MVRIALPHADTAAGSVRPGLAIATPAATDTFGIVWLLMTTSARHAGWPDDVAVDDPASAGLSTPVSFERARSPRSMPGSLQRSGAWQDQTEQRSPSA